MDQSNGDGGRDQPSGVVSRRGFLKGAGASAAGTVLLEGGLSGVAEAQARAAEPKVLGSGPVELTLHINGRPRHVKVEPRETLAHVLRDELNLTGTKVVCDRGACSACTVFLDGTPVCSCMTLAIDVGRRQVKTIEGLALGDELHPVQEAFIEHDALQCGFCTPGMVMAAIDLVTSHPQGLSEAQIRHGLEGNLCRCTGYHNIVKAISAAWPVMHGKAMPAAAE